MHRISLSILFVLITLLGVGCGPDMVIEGSGKVMTETRQVSNFSQIELLNSGNVILTQSDRETLRIEAEANLMPYIVTEVVGDTLKIYFESDRPLDAWPTKPVKYYVTMKDVKGLQVHGSGDIFAERLAADSLLLVIAGSGDITVNQLDVKKLDSVISGSGDLLIDQLKADSVETVISSDGNCSLAGRTARQSMHVSGSGDYSAFDLQSQTASIQVAGSGDVDVWVTEILDANISGSGDLTYYGTPSIRKHVSGDGDISGLGAH
jgi:hypothetical protein